MTKDSEWHSGGAIRDLLQLYEGTSSDRLPAFSSHLRTSLENLAPSLPVNFDAQRAGFDFLFEAPRQLPTISLLVHSGRRGIGAILQSPRHPCICPQDMSRSAEIRKLKQEAELLRAVAVEKGIVGSSLDQAAWERVARVMNLNATTVK